MVCAKTSAKDAEFPLDKVSVVGMFCCVFIFFQHSLPYPCAERLAGLRIAQNVQQPLPLCAENGLIGVGDELA